MADPRKAAELAQDIKDSVLELSDGRRFPDLMAAIDQLAALSQPAEGQEPLFLLYTGQIDSSGEQDEWETEADSWNRVEAFCRANPGKTIGLYPVAQPVQVQVHEGWRPSEAQYREWCERHDLPERHSREAFDDAVSLHLLAAAPLPPAQPTHTNLDPNESDPIALWAEICRLREAIQGPDGYETWQQAATAERARRVKAERDACKEPVNRRLLEAAKDLHAVLSEVMSTGGWVPTPLHASLMDAWSGVTAAIAEAEAQAAQPVGREALDERKEAERVYSITAFDYPANPIGSREWCLFWDGWRSRAELGITGEGA